MPRVLAIISILTAGSLLSACSFHLRGISGSYKLPYKTIMLECTGPIICNGLKKSLQTQALTTIVTQAESAEAIISVSEEQTSRNSLDFNKVGQIASYILTYQITARVYTPGNDQVGNDIVVKNQQIMAYNNSLILSAQQQEDASWDAIHQNVINELIRRLVYFKTTLISTNYDTESRSMAK